MSNYTPYDITGNDESQNNMYAFVQFVDFLKENNVISIAIASVISERVSNLVNSFVDGFVLPILEQDNDGDGKADISALEEKHIHIGNVKLKVGKFAVALIKFIIITYVIFIISRLLKNLHP